MSAPLRAPHEVVFTYRRSVGGATEQFLRGLARGELLGSRTGDGRVVVPLLDPHPGTGAPLDDPVVVSDVGEIRSWTWVERPGPDHPLAAPFAFALIQLDGTDSSFLHVVDVGSPEDLATGMRVRADWRRTRSGSILDIRAFVPDTGAEEPPSAGGDASPEPLTVDTQLRIRYWFEPGLARSEFFRTLAAGRITGGRCDTCSTVYVPPHGSCPVCGRIGMSPVDVADRGVVASFAVVHLPVAGMELDLPYVWAWIRLDDVDVPFPHLLGDVAPDDVHVGQRIEAVWVAGHERPASWEAIRHFRPVAP